MLSSEMITVIAPFAEQEEQVSGLALLDNRLLLHAKTHWGQFNLAGEMLEIVKAPGVDDESQHWEMLSK